jgi:hypothetical protein
MLTGTYNGTIGDETAVPSFYDEFAVAHHKPLAVTETAALYAPARPGDETAMKQAWWQQVFDPGTLAKLPGIAMINWFEWDKYESEIHGEVDRAVTKKPPLAAAFAAALPPRLRWAGTVPDCLPG